MGQYLDPDEYDGQEPYAGPTLEQLRAMEPIYYCYDCDAFVFMDGDDVITITYQDNMNEYDILTEIWVRAPLEHTDVDPENNICDVCGGCCHNTAVPVPTQETCQSVWISFAEETAAYYAQYDITIDLFEFMYCPVCEKYVLDGEAADADEVAANGFVINQPSDHKDDNEDGKCDFCGISLAAECTHETLTPTEAVPATCQTAGNSAYWTCDDCGLYFSDENAENEIAEGAWVLEVDPDAHNFGGDAVTGSATTSTFSP